MKPTTASDPRVARTLPEITIRVIDAPIMDRMEVAVALRTLARLLVRRRGQKGDPKPNVARQTRSFPLTVVPHPSPDHGDATV